LFDEPEVRQGPVALGNTMEKLALDKTHKYNEQYRSLAPGAIRYTSCCFFRHTPTLLIPGRGLAMD
jgi:hypothetical protein